MNAREHALTGEAAPAASIPHQSYASIFLRFLRFGSLAWGGPVAQIGMLKRELVDEEHWVTPQRFNRALAVYQVLPGPEAHELCVYFGFLARGRLGGLLAGLGFMLPGFVLMFLLSWLYVYSAGNLAAEWRAIFLALQAAVVALIVRAVHRIGSHALHDRRLVLLAAASFVASLLGVHFAINLASTGALYALVSRGQRAAWVALALLWTAITAYFALMPMDEVRQVAAPGVTNSATSPPFLFYSGLKSGLLTFGGAYTVIPFLQADAVVHGAWMSNDQFLDGLALSGILPAPLIIFATFVGFIGGGPLGALVLTAGIFLPAFAFTLVAHEPLERITQDPRVHRVLEGVTAGVVGLIAATTVELAPAALGSVAAGVVFLMSLTLLYLVKHKLNVLLVMGLSALTGLFFFG